MSLRRLGTVLRAEMAFTLRRPLWWILILLFAFNAWGLSAGALGIQAGDASVGGTKAWITSEFAVAMIVSITIPLFATFFAAVASGMAVIRDEEQKAGEILYATRLTAAEYTWGKFLGSFAPFLLALGIDLLFTILFFQIVPNEKSSELRGPFALRNYLMPMIVFGVPVLTVVAGAAFTAGARWRRPILVFVMPVALVCICGFFLWDWSPTWLDPRINSLLMHIDPAGFRWMNETWLKQDRGVKFYNESPIGYDLPFIASRLAWMAFAMLGVAWAARGMSARFRGAERRWKFSLQRRAAAPAAEPQAASVLGTRPLRVLAMRSGAPGFLRGAFEVARIEFRELRSSPGLYLFVPLILLQTLGGSLVALGPFQTWVLLTPGTLAVRMMNTLTLLVCLLILFYTVESLQREANTGFGSIFHATPVGSGSILFGKALANSLVGVAILLACLAGCLIALLVQKTVPISLEPFVLVWGLLLLPTFLLWSSFVMAVHALTKNRYASYGIALGTLELESRGV